MTEHVTWLTQEAYDRLKEELDDRSGPQRAEITKRIELARQEGDLKENGGYHAAREAQGMNEARIRHLAHLLEHAHIGTGATARLFVHIHWRNDSAPLPEIRSLPNEVSSNTATA